MENRRRCSLLIVVHCALRGQCQRAKREEVQLQNFSGFLVNSLFRDALLGNSARLLESALLEC